MRTIKVLLWVAYGTMAFMAGYLVARILYTVTL